MRCLDVELRLQRRQRQLVMVRRGKTRPFRCVALDDLRPAHPVLRQVDRGRHRRQRRRGEEDRNPDPDLNLGKPLQAPDRCGGPRTQPLDQQEVARTETQQHEEHGDLGTDHHAIRGAVKPRPVADILHAHDAAAHHDAGNAGHRHARSAPPIAMFLMLLGLGAGNFLLVEQLRARSAPVGRLKQFAEVEVGISCDLLRRGVAVRYRPNPVKLAGKSAQHTGMAASSPDHDKLALPALRPMSEQRRAAAPPGGVRARFSATCRRATLVGIQSPTVRIERSNCCRIIRRGCAGYTIGHC